jgi:hypothetical protein
MSNLGITSRSVVFGTNPNSQPSEPDKKDKTLDIQRVNVYNIQPVDVYDKSPPVPSFEERQKNCQAATYRMRQQGNVYDKKPSESP